MALCSEIYEVLSLCLLLCPPAFFLCPHCSHPSLLTALAQQRKAG
uniref:Uncharacterized protein n=1 Tax=Anguilla anguilla TaxID=7936 RepID=A0A0E9XE75_ANGAN